MNVEQDEARTTAPAYSLGASPFYGYNNPDSPWHSDAGTLLTLIAKNPSSTGISPTQLKIRSGAAIDNLQMWVTPTNSDQPPVALSQFGGSGGSLSQLDQKQIELISSVAFWGTRAWDTPRLGQMMITFKNNVYPPQTFGKNKEFYLGTFEIPSGQVLLGFTGDSGSMVDGISLIVGAEGA